MVGRFALLRVSRLAAAENTTTDSLIDFDESGILDRVDVLGQDLPSVGIGLDGSGMLVQDINLFQGEALGFGNEEVGEDETSQASAAPDEEHFGFQASVTGTGPDEEGCGIADGPIEEPVASSGQSDTLATDIEREDFPNNDPGNGSPS